MGYICAICSESIEKSPGGLPESQNRTATKLSNLSAALCGHLFHSYCINKWMNSGISSSNLCPNCRKCIPRGSCLDLFPDSYDDHSSPNSPDPGQKVKCDQHEKDIASLRSKLYTVEADFKIQLSLYELLAKDHQQRNTQFYEETRKKELEFVTFKADTAASKHQLELEVQKLKLELDIMNHKLQAERNGRLVDRKMHIEFFQRLSVQMQAQQVDVLNYSMQLQRDLPMQKIDEPKPGPSRLCKPIKSRPGVTFSKPRRGKKMVYEKGPDSDEIEQVELDESDNDDDFDIVAGPDSRKRKLISIRNSAGSDAPKLKTKRITSTDLSLSPITLTLSSDTEDERDLIAVTALTTGTIGASNGPLSILPEPANMDITETNL